jgi:predicted transcriptional regulator YheO
LSSHVSQQGDLRLLEQVAEAIAATFGPTCEVVVHDLRKPDKSIVAIFNGHVTERQVGDAMPDRELYELASRYEDRDVVAGYRAHTKDGGPLRSTTLFIRNAKGHPYAALGINLDVGVAEALHAHTSFLLGRDGYEKQAPIAKRRVSHMFRDLMDEALSQVHKPVARFNRGDRIRVVASLEERGAFVIRGSMTAAARRLGVSRMAMYTYLDEARQQLQSTGAGAHRPAVDAPTNLVDLPVASAGRTSDSGR